MIAVDPGANGGIAWRDAAGDSHCMPMPSTEIDVILTLRSLVLEHRIRNAFVEDVGKGVIPGRALAMISLNVSAAVIRTTLSCCSVRVVQPKPREWQIFFGLGKRRDCASDSVWKNKLKAEAQRRFPNCEVTLKTADALLILEYGISRKGV